jgi:serine/threonine protein kinase
MRMSASLVGRTLGDFQITAEIGRGSMARVYKAWQVSLRRHVGLKVLEEGLFTPGENVKRFLREEIALARLEHPHIVPVYAAGEDPPYYYFAMRLITGGTLLDALRARVSMVTSVEWVWQTCRALAYAHQQDIIHRDLKPTNILLQNGVAFLSDFGLARLRDLSTLTRDGFTLGTPLYMAPEQTRGEEAVPASDCFALGVILYQLLTHRHPFIPPEWGETVRAERRTALFERIRAGVYTPPRELEPQIIPALEQVIQRALRPRVEDRYVHGGQMLADLAEAWRQLRKDEHDVPAELAPPLPAPSPTPAPSSSPTEETVEISPEPSPAPESPPTRRRTRFGRYEVREELGHGGQGVVYHAYDTVLERDVALKVLQTFLHGDPEMVELFRHEARVAAHLNHSNIVPIYDFGIEAGSPFLTMPFVDGPSLDHLIARNGALPLGFCLRVLVQTADALEYAHSCQVVHLDLKPGNLLLRSKPPADWPASAPRRWQPNLLLTDFTMARWRHANARGKQELAPDQPANTILARHVRCLGGTLPYASPEQVSGDETAVGPASDFFSLGVVFYEILTRVRPFDQPTASATQVRLLAGDARPPSTLRKDLPREIDSLCAELLAATPEKRIQNAETVAERVQPLLLTVGD